MAFNPYGDWAGVMGSALIQGASAYGMARKAEQERLKAEADALEAKKMRQEQFDMEKGKYAMYQRQAESGLATEKIKQDMYGIEAREKEQKMAQEEMLNAFAMAANSARAGDFATASQAVKKYFPNTDVVSKGQDGGFVVRTKQSDGTSMEREISEDDLDKMGVTAKERLLFSTRQTAQEGRVANMAQKADIEKEKIKLGYARLEAVKDRALAAGVKLTVYQQKKMDYEKQARERGLVGIEAQDYVNQRMGVDKTLQGEIKPKDEFRTNATRINTLTKEIKDAINPAQRKALEDELAELKARNKELTTAKPKANSPRGPIHPADRRRRE